MINYNFPDITKKEIRAEIAKRLHYERLQANLSLEDLAAESGYSKPTVQKWEKGWELSSGENIIPTMDQLISLCAIYNCAPGYLLCEFDEKIQCHADISLATGLTPESITMLQKCFSPLVTPPYMQAAYIVYLSFLNHYIQNMGNLFPAFWARSNLAYRQEKLEHHKYKELIIEAYQEAAVHDFIFYTGDAFTDIIEKTALRDPFIKFFSSKNVPTEDIESLIEDAIEFSDILFTNKLKQSDFTISDTFLDIAKDFFSNNSPNLTEYKEFIEKCRNTYDQIIDNNKKEPGK